jgi:hypothetical protein
MSVGTSISVMTLLSIFETSCGCFSWQRLSSGWSPLNTLIPSIWSLNRQPVRGREKVGGLVEFNADDFKREMDTEGEKGQCRLMRGRRESDGATLDAPRRGEGWPEGTAQ